MPRPKPAGYSCDMLTSADFEVDYFLRPRRQWALRPPQTQCQPMYVWNLLTGAAFAVQ